VKRAIAAALDAILVRHLVLSDSCLPLLPPAAMSRRATTRSRGRTELRAGLAGVGGLDHLARAAERFYGLRALGTEGQGFRAVHFVEMGLVDF
jgi:hypothetical protein